MSLLLQGGIGQGMELHGLPKIFPTSPGAGMCPVVAKIITEFTIVQARKTIIIPVIAAVRIFFPELILLESAVEVNRIPPPTINIKTPRGKRIYKTKKSMILFNKTKR